MFNFRDGLDGPFTAGASVQSFPSGAARTQSGAQSFSPLVETLSFGRNPGQLRMFSYVPTSAGSRPPLVVVLHGCGQTAAGYERGAGWSTLADRNGFALLLPEQQRSNNPNGCFNWFQAQDSTRERGEAASIHQMIQTMVREHGFDQARVFVTGMSAGGAMTSIMLACYPETFAAGAIIAGLPYGAAANAQQAFQSMFQCPQRTEKKWGDLVREASEGNRGAWPRVSVWHGDVDKTVIPANAGEIIKQWTNVHGLPDAPSREDEVDGYRRRSWLDAAGFEIVESYTITGMAHGTPLATGEAASDCGVAGPFLIDVGISSSFHIARFFGITQSDAREVAPGRAHGNTELNNELRAGRQSRNTLNIPRPRKTGGSRFDIGSVISAALRKAGLSKG